MEERAARAVHRSVFSRFTSTSKSDSSPIASCSWTSTRAIRELPAKSGAAWADVSHVTSSPGKACSNTVARKTSPRLGTAETPSAKVSVSPVLISNTCGTGGF